MEWDNGYRVQFKVIVDLTTELPVSIGCQVFTPISTQL